MLISATAYAQFPEPRMVQTDSGLVTYHYFKSGAISTYKRDGQVERLGEAIAYDSTGRIIAKHPCGYKHGRRGVEFKYHANGAVSTIRISHQPDGGAQSYNITYLYDNAGKFLGEKDNSIPPKLVTIPTHFIGAATHNKHHGISESLNVFEITNATPHVVWLEIKSKKGKYKKEIKLKPGETQKGGTYPLANGSPEKPENKYVFTVNSKIEGQKLLIKQWETSPVKNNKVLHSLFVLQNRDNF